MDPVQKAIWGGVVPAALAVLFPGLALLAASRGLGGRRLAAWAVPLAAAGGMLISFAMQFAESSGRWLGILWAASAALLLWPVVLAPWPQRRLLIAFSALAPLSLAAVAGAAMWGTFYDSQPDWQRWLPIVSTLLLALALYALAIRWATPADGIAVAIAGLMLTPIVVFSGNATFAELLATAAVAGGAASLMALSVRGERYDDWRHGVSAGALGLALVYPLYAVLAWGNSYDLPNSHAWALLLPCAAVPLVWVSRIPGLSRKALIAGIIAITCVTLIAGAGFVLAYREADTAAYDPGF